MNIGRDGFPVLVIGERPLKPGLLQQGKRVGVVVLLLAEGICETDDRLLDDRFQGTFAFNDLAPLIVATQVAKRWMIDGVRSNLDEVTGSQFPKLGAGHTSIRPSGSNQGERLPPQFAHRLLSIRDTSR
jgi:hypothetical protein